MSVASDSLEILIRARAALSFYLEEYYRLKVFSAITADELVDTDGRNYRVLWNIGLTRPVTHCEARFYPDETGGILHVHTLHPPGHETHTFPSEGRRFRLLYDEDRVLRWITPEPMRKAA